MMVLAIIFGLAGWAYAAFQQVMHARDMQEVREHHAHDMQLEQQRVDQLITQVQVTAQGMPHYPTLGPFPQEPETTRKIYDDTGLIEVEVPLDEDADFAEFDTSYSYNGAD